MNSERWQKVKRLFETVVELEPAKRKRFLDKSCGTDKELRRDVENLLSSYTDAESFMEQPAAAEVASFIIEPKNLEAGKSFGHYEIIKQIGAGGMGEVYLAEDKKLDRKVAVKILNEKFAKHESNLHRFIKEAKAASALNHPNILVIHEIGETEDANYIVSEYIEGETLREVIKKSPLKLSEILEISTQIANALVAAHSANIVHRDIKPENIIVRPDGYVKILDFGLAKLVEQKIVGLEASTVKQNETAKGVILGTVNYMSPEQAKGEKVDARTDIFSFGVTLYEMIAGKTPFHGNSMSETLANLINAEPQPLSRFSTDVPDELQRIVAKTLRKNKDERYQTMKGLFADLKSLQRRLEFETELKKNSRSEKKIEEKTQIFETKTSREIPKLPPNNLSENIFPIVGREKEITEIKNMLRQTNARLLTMTGIGGTGKTTLARAVAGELLDEFADGVFFIGLAAITDSELVASSIAQTLGVKEAGGKPLLEILKNYLRGKQILLVLDNFEQVTDAAPTVAELLSAANRLKILITSRTLLYLSAEHEFIVPPLSLPSDISEVSFDDLSNYEAVQLFDQCARNIKPNFALTEENAIDVAEICARLDGLPLAIELAAARIKILSPRAILAKLENRLKLLTGGASDLPARQQTMRGAIEWSYDILTADEKKLFRRLSVFAGGFSFEAAEAVCGNYELSEDRIEVLDLITSLVDKSLIVQKEQPNDEFRFRMLEVVREYAAEVLEASGESEAARKNHAAFFLQLAETAQPHFFDEQGAKWLNRLEEEYDNLRAALSWSAVSDAEMTINLAVAVRTFWILHNHLTEGRKWFEAALERATDAPSDTRFKLLYGFGQAAIYQGDIETARQMFEESLAVSKEAGEKRQIALASRGLGMTAKLQGDFSTARKFIDESLKISRELNDKHGIAVSLNNLGDLARIESDFKTARLLLEEALAICRELGNKEGICGCLNNLAASAFGEGNFAAASVHYAEAITTALDLGDKITVSYSLDGFAALALKNGKKENAARLAGAVEHLYQSIGFAVEPAERRFRDAYLSELKIKMDEAAFSEFYEQGRRMRLEEAVALCLEENPEDETSNKKSIAVLPFANISADTENEYFCDGLAEELLNALSKIKDLNVAARTSAFAFKGRNTNVGEIGKILNVNTILEGSVRKSGNRLRISVQLINASNGYHLWSERYDGEMKDIFDLQDEITLAIIDELKVKFLSEEKAALRHRRAENVEAYQLYLKGRYHFLKLIPPEIEKGISYFHQAIALEPNYAPAYAGLTAAYVTFPMTCDSPPEEFFPKAKAAAQKAIEIDDSLSETYSALFWATFWYDWNWSECERQCLRAIELNPNSGDAHESYAHLLSNVGRHSEAIAEIKRARELDPLHLRINALEGQFLLHSGKPDEALEPLQKALELLPQFWLAHLFLASVYIEKGMFNEANESAREARKFSGISTHPIAFEGYALAKSGKEKEAQATLEELLQISTERYVPSSNIAMIYNGLGETENTLDYLERAFDERDARMAFLKVEPKWNNLRRDSRFQDLMRRVGFSPDDTAEDNKINKANSTDTNEPSGDISLKTSAENDSTAEILSPKSSGIIKNQKYFFVSGLVIFLITAIGFGYYFYYSKTSSSGANIKKSLAVLPFINASQDANAEYLSDGITESIINNLSQITSLRVMSRNSAFRFKNNQTDVKNIASQLGVETLVTGDIKQLGDKFVINVRLIDARDDSQIWGNQYVKSSADIIAVQNEIVQAVANNLRVKLTNSEEQKLAKNYTENVEAYEFYLKGRFYVSKATLPEINKGISYFQQAIDLDPNYALAYTGLAEAYRALVLSADRPPTEFLKAKAAAKKAIELDDSLSEAHHNLGAVTFFYDWDWKESENQFQRALELDPGNAYAHWVYALLLSATLRHTEALAEVKRARELDPLNLMTHMAEGVCLNAAGKPDEALASMQKALELNPNFWAAHLMISDAYMQKGMFAEAIAEARKAKESNSNNAYFDANIGYALAKSGKPAEARAVLNELLKSSTEHYVPPLSIAVIYNGLDERDETLNWLERGVDVRDGDCVFLKVSPVWNNLRNEPRFIELMRRMNFE